MKASKLMAIAAILFLAQIRFATAQTNSAMQLPEPLDLDSCCKIALEHNQSLLLAKELIRQQDGTLTAQEAAGLPQLGIDSDYNRTDPSRIEAFGPSSAVNDQTWSADLQLSQALYSGGRLHYNLEEQKHVKSALTYGKDDAANIVLRDTTVAFHAAILARDHIAVHEQSVTLLTQALTLASNRFTVGAGPSFDVLSADVALRNEQPLLVKARYDYDSALDSLRQEMGIPFDTNTSPSTLKDPADEPLPTIAGSTGEAVAAAMSTRPDLKELEEVVAAQEADLEVQKRGYTPSVGLTADYGLQNRHFSTDDSSTLDGWKVAASLTWPLFDSGLTRGRIAQSKSQLTEKQIQQAQARLAAETDLRSQLNTCKSSAEILSASDLVIKQGEEAEKLAQNRLQAGAGTQQDVLQSQVELTKARLQKAEARYDYNVALVHLRYAMAQLKAP